MNKIDTKNRKEFNLRDIGFLNFHGKRIRKSDRNDGNLIFITAGTENLGVSGTIGNKVDVWKYPITVDMFGNCFYHHCECYGDDNIYAFINNNVNKYQKLFLASCINEKINDLFSYKNQFRQEHANQLTIKLPIDSNGNPDREYMESYMKNIEEKCKQSLEELKRVRNTMNHKIDTVDWKEFKIGDLFEIINGKGITKEELFLNPGKIVAIQSGEENNGCIGFIDERYCIEKGYHIEKNPCLTVARSGSSGHITVQNKPFVVGDSAKILKSYYSLNIYQLVFLKSILMQLKKKYSYNDKVSEKKYQEETIKLPVDHEGNPNRAYMESYMKNLMEKNREKLKCLN